MQIARPSNGFRLVENPRVFQTIESVKRQCPWLERAYSDLRERLRMAGHRVGDPIRPTDMSQRVYIEADPETGDNRMCVSYRVLGDTLTIKAIKVIVANNLSTRG